MPKLRGDKNWIKIGQNENSPPLCGACPTLKSIFLQSMDTSARPAIIQNSWGDVKVEVEALDGNKKKFSKMMLKWEADDEEVKYYCVTSKFEVFGC